jgi:hypothetical protein
MNILNVVTYSALSIDGKRYEATHNFNRSKKLTVIGAQRVLRKNFRAAKQAHGNLIVTRVETFVDAR